MTPFRLPQKRRGARNLVQIAAGLVLAVSLAGCAPVNTGLQPETARQLQARVLNVSEAAASSDHAGALEALDNLEAELSSAAGNGQITDERRRNIMTIITAVRAALTAEIEAAEAAAAAKATEEAAAVEAAEKAETDAPAVEQPAAPVPVEPAAPVPVDPTVTAPQEGALPVDPVPVPEQEPAPGDEKSNEGKGKGKGKND